MFRAIWMEVVEFFKSGMEEGGEASERPMVGNNWRDFNYEWFYLRSFEVRRRLIHKAFASE